jgi:hypothetical protein
MNAMKDKYFIILLVILGIIFYSLTLRGVVGNVSEEQVSVLDSATQPFELSPERGKFASVVSLSERGTFALSPSLVDFVYPDVGVYEGSYYSYLAPGVVYLVVPFYELGKVFGYSQAFAFASASFAAIFSLVLVFLIGRRVFCFSISASFFSSAIFGFSTIGWSYAVTLYQHQFTALFLLLGFYSAWKFRQNERYSLIWAVIAWLSVGLAVSVDYPNALLVLPIVFYLLAGIISLYEKKGSYRLRVKLGAVIAAAVLVLVAGLNLYHNNRYFGGAVRLAGELPSIVEIERAGTEHDGEAEKSIALDKSFTGFFSETNLLRGFRVLTVSLDRGTVLYSPILLFGLLGIYFLRKEMDAPKIALVSIIALNLFIYSSWGDPWGGWAFGPRYLIPSMAILSLFASAAVFRSFWTKLFAFMLAAYSAGIAVLGAVTSNAVPPKSEAVHLPLNYHNFLYNIHLAGENKSGSLIFNEYLSGYLSVTDFIVLLWLAVMLMLSLVLVFGSLRHP